MYCWKDTYKNKLLSMEDAAKIVDSGDSIWFGETCCVPYNFLNELYKRKDELSNVTIMYNFSVGMFDMLFEEDSKNAFRIFSFFTGPIDRMSGQMGIAEYHTAPYEYLLRSAVDVYKCNSVIYEICPPDEDGYCNAGILGEAFATDFLKYESKITKRIAIVNPQQGPAQGEEKYIKIKADWFDYFVEDSHELPYIPASPPSEVDQLIGGFIMDYVQDGDCIQIGMGGLGEQIAQSLSAKKNITIYTEITTDSMVPLVECGSVSKVITCGAFGSPKVYEFLATSPTVEFRPLSLMLDPAIIGQQDNLVTVNSTLMVDLTGQACSEAQGINQYSSVGGSFGFSYGATRSKGGRGFLCLRSTYKDKEGVRQSSIVPWLPEKSVVTTPRYMQMYIVSEHGVADVFLKTNKDRIKALIKIAHPDFRPLLKEQIIASGQITEDDF